MVYRDRRRRRKGMDWTEMSLNVGAVVALESRPPCCCNSSIHKIKTQLAGHEINPNPRFASPGIVLWWLKHNPATWTRSSNLISTQLSLPCFLNYYEMKKTTPLIASLISVRASTVKAIEAQPKIETEADNGGLTGSRRRKLKNRGPLSNSSTEWVTRNKTICYSIWEDATDGVF